jgi:hypothetical protein
VGVGEAGKKAKTTPDAGEKSVSEKSQATRTCRNPFEKSKSKQTEFFVREVKDKRMTKNGPEFLIGWRDFPLERDDTWEPISNLTGSEHMICEFQKQHALDYEMKTAAVLKQVADRKKAVNEKNASTALDKTADDIQEARDDNACDDAEEEDDEEEEHGEGRAASGVQRKRRQERSFYFTTEAVKRMHSKEGGILTAMCQVGGQVECKKTITMPNGGHVECKKTITMPRPGKTRVTHFFQWSLNVFIWIILKEKSMIRKYKSLNLAFWMTSWVSVAHQWMSTRPLSTGRPN